MGRHFIWHLLGVPGSAAGAFCLILPLVGTAMVIHEGRFSVETLKDALLWVIPGFILFFGARGVSVDPETREIRLWVGLACTRHLVLPLWKRRKRVFKVILIRLIVQHHPKGGRTRQPAVFLLDVAERWTLVGATWTRAGAQRMAERLSSLSGLPVA